MIATASHIPNDLVGYDPVATAGKLVTVDTDRGIHYFDSGLSYHEGAADHAVRFIETLCCHVKGRWAGQPFLLEPWEAAFIRTLFGWKRKNRTRRYRMAYVEIPRKNGKSLLTATIGVYLLIADGEKGGEIYSAATTREQAGIVHRMAADMIKHNKLLSQRCEDIPSRNRIIHPESNSFYKAVPAEAGAQMGWNAHGILFDELHEQKTRDLWDALFTSRGSREQPLAVAITTAGKTRLSLCGEQHDYAEKVRDGIIDDTSFLPVLYFADVDKDWTDPEVWKEANPNYGVSVSHEYLAAECKRAQETPGYENTFRRLHLNQWVEQDIRWLSMEKWDACGGERTDLAGRECFAGLDLASTIDVTALVLVFPDDDGGYSLLPHFWIPREGARERERKDRVPYVEWARQGYLEIAGDKRTDYDVIRKRINELGQRYNIREIGVDPWNATQLSLQLAGDGFEVVHVPQSFREFTTPSKEFEAQIVNGTLRHFNHPVLRWMASNVSAKDDTAGNLMPCKKKSFEKIDGIVAAIMGIGRALVTPPARESKYEREGLLSF